MYKAAMYSKMYKAAMYSQMYNAAIYSKMYRTGVEVSHAHTMTIHGEINSIQTNQQMIP
jgi:hypothetical protein